MMILGPLLTDIGVIGQWNEGHQDGRFPDKSEVKRLRIVDRGGDKYCLGFMFNRDSDYDDSEDVSDGEVAGGDGGCAEGAGDGDRCSKGSSFDPPKPGSWRFPSPLPLPKAKVAVAESQSQCGSVGGVEGGVEEEGASSEGGGEGGEGDASVSDDGSEGSWATVGTEERAEAENAEDAARCSIDELLIKGPGCKNCGSRVITGEGVCVVCGLAGQSQLGGERVWEDVCRHLAAAVLAWDKGCGYGELEAGSAVR